MFGVLIGIFVLVWVYKLQSKVDVLTTEVESLRKHTPASSVQQPVQVAHVATSIATPSVETTATQMIQPQAVHVPVQVQPPAEAVFVAWIKQDFFVKLGALFLLIGFGWFVSYAFAHQWIGEVGRITLGLLAGVGILAFGTWRIKTYLHQGSIFLVLGSTTILLTVFAAREIYDFFTPTSALCLMFLSIVFVAYVSVMHKNQQLALASLILASIAPFLTNAPTPDVVGLFTYLLAVVLGTLWVVYLTGSRTLTFAALIIVMLYGLPFVVEFGFTNNSDRDIALLFSFIFTAVFFVANIVSMIYRQQQEVLQAHLATACGTGMYLIMWVVAAAPQEMQSLLFAAWMVVFGLGSYIVFTRVQHKGPFYLYGAVSLVLLAAATAAELEGPLLTIAFTLEVGVLVMLTRFFTKDVAYVQKTSLLFIIPVLLSLQSVVSSAWNDGFLHGDFFVLVVLAMTFVIASLSLIKRNEAGEESSMQLALMFAVAGVTYMLVLIWLVLHALLPDDAATTISLIVYAVIGLSLFIKGRIEDEKLTRVAGAALLGFVAAHLLLIDVWQMELAGRIITFFALGTLLISTAFLGQKKKAQPEQQ